MKPKHFLLFLLFVCHGLIAKAQKLLYINVAADGKQAYIHSIGIRTGNLLLKLSAKGDIVIDALNPYARYEYWSHIDASYRQGKLKAIDQTPIDYYDDFNLDGNTGKLLSVGRLPVTYYDRFDMDGNQGKIKSIGNITFTYYDRFDMNDNQGKLKSIGNMMITYYDRFDMNDNQGKLKSVGRSTITYYDRFDLNNQGYIKSISSGNPLLRVIDPTDELYESQ